MSSEFNSNLASEYARMLDVAAIIHIQDLQDLLDGGIAIPEWLRGVPTLVDASTGDVYEGSSAVKMIFQLKVIHTNQDTNLKPSANDDENATPVTEPSEESGDEFAPLVDPNDMQDDDDSDKKKIDIEDINKQLSLRGINGGLAGESDI